MVELLKADGFDVFEAASGRLGIERFTAVEPDVVLLDARLPDGDGQEVLEHIRSRASTPVLFVTANDGEIDRVRGLDSGADDYIVKPFLGAELRARVRAAIRRSRLLAPRQRMTFGPLEIDVDARVVSLDGKPVAMRQKEFDLLVALAMRPGAVLTRDQLLREVWGTKTEWQDPATVTEHIRRIRLKIERDPDNPQSIVTFRGVGYCFRG